MKGNRMNRILPHVLVLAFPSVAALGMPANSESDFHLSADFFLTVFFILAGAGILVAALLLKLGKIPPGPWVGYSPLGHVFKGTGVLLIGLHRGLGYVDRLPEGTVWRYITVFSVTLIIVGIGIERKARKARQERD